MAEPLDPWLWLARVKGSREKPITVEAMTYPEACQFAASRLKRARVDDVEVRVVREDDLRRRVA